MTLRRRMAIHGVGACLTVLAFGCAPGLANMQGGIRDDLRRSKRVFDICQGIDQVESATWSRSRLLVGTDPAAIDRILATLTGKAAPARLGASAPFSPWAEIAQQLQEIETLTRLGDHLDVPGRDTVKQSRPAVMRARQAVERVAKHWEEAGVVLREVVDRIGKSGVLTEINACAEHDVRRATGSKASPCAMPGVAALGVWLAEGQNRDRIQQTLERIPADIDELTRSIRELMEITQKLRHDAENGVPPARGIEPPPAPSAPAGSAAAPGGNSATGATPTQATTGAAGAKTPPAPVQIADLLQKTNFALREMAAFGGILRDGSIALRRLASIGDNPLAAAEEIGRFLLDAESDRIVDLLFLWLTDAVGKVDKAIAQLDEQSYGAASALVSLGLETEVVEEATCAVGKEAKAFLVQEGLLPGSLGARVCRAAVGTPSNFPKSSVLARVYEGLIGAASDLSCKDALQFDEKGTGRSGAATSARALYTIASNGGGGWRHPSTTESERLIDATEALAQATWKARVQVADSGFARLTHPYQFGEHSMPLLRDVPRGLGAAYLLVEQRERDLLDSLRDRPFEQFFMAQTMVLSLSYAASPDIYGSVCRDQIVARTTSIGSGVTLVPLACSNILIDNRVAGPTIDLAPLSQATQQAAWELCSNNAKLDRKAEIESTCAALADPKDDSSPLHCQAAGYGAIVSVPKAVFMKLAFLAPIRPSETESSKAVKGGSVKGDFAIDRAQGVRQNLQSAARRLDDRRKGLSGNGNVIRFVGSASTEIVEVPEARPFILRALLVEAATIESRQHGASADLTARWCLPKQINATTWVCEVNAAVKDGVIVEVESLLDKPGSSFIAKLCPVKNSSGKCKGVSDEATNIANNFLKYCTVANGHATPTPPSSTSETPMLSVFEPGAIGRIDGYAPPPQKPSGTSILIRSSFTADHGHPAVGWVREIVNEFASKAPGSDQALSDAANELLAVFRAIGAAEIMLEHAPGLCTATSCTIEGIGPNIASATGGTKRDLGEWRSLSLVLAHSEPIPLCNGLASPDDTRRIWIPP